MALDEPVLIVVEAELLERPVEVVQIGESADREELYSVPLCGWTGNKGPKG